MWLILERHLTGYRTDRGLWQDVVYIERKGSIVKFDISACCRYLFSAYLQKIAVKIARVEIKSIYESDKRYVIF